METPDHGRTQWDEPGNEPGERGPAVITGHVDSTNGPAVFYRLRELRRGNLIQVRRADGSVVRFRVEGLERWPKATFRLPGLRQDVHLDAATRHMRWQLSTLRPVTIGTTPSSTRRADANDPIAYSARVSGHGS